MYHQLPYMQSNTSRKKLNRNMIEHLNINFMALFDTYSGSDAFCNIRKYFEMFKMTKMLDVSSKK